LRVDGLGGHLSMDTDANLRLKVLGEAAREVEYVRDKTHFAGDCVYALQRHFVDCMLTGREFESNGRDYLKTVSLVEAVYESALKSEVVRL
jgi:predicted dehydrogenase